MRNLSLPAKWASLVFVIAVCLQGFVTSSVLADSTNAVSTNGLYAVGHVQRRSKTIHRVQLAVHLVFEPGTKIERSFIREFTCPGTNFYAALSNGTGEFYDPSPNWMYFMATNSFLGPMELRDSDGNSLSPTTETINAPKAYPTFYGLRDLWSHARRRWESPCVLVPEQDTIANVPGFSLEDCFKIEKPGHYTLTIWPKIYKRTSHGADTCQKVDLPPLSIPFEWP